MGSVAEAPRLQSTDSGVVACRGVWDLPESGIEPMSPVLAGGFFTTEPPEKPSRCLLKFKYSKYLNR